MSVRNHLEEVKKNIEIHARKFGHSAKDISLVGVTKVIEDELVKEALDAGLKNVGENKVQEITKKMPMFRSYDKVKIHMIGHLQSNKVKNLLDVDLIQSVDRKSLLKEMEKIGKREDHVFQALVQINVAGEGQKGGINPNNLDELLDYIEGLEHVKIHGFMNMAPFTEDEKVLRKNFSTMRKLFEKHDNIVYNNIQMDILSMGMSNDYKIALEEGANMVRIGTSIFGQRNYNK